jgi:predicted patatin/cPLA2 family phospholipase
MKQLILFISFVGLCGISLAKPCRVLVLSGGGSHGAFQAGVIKKLHENGKNWDIITGVSAGSFNTAFLGLFSQQNQSFGIKVMTETWLNMTSNNVYLWNWNPIYDQSILDNAPLNKTIYELVKKYGGKARRDIIMGATNLNTGRLELFNRTDFTSVNKTASIVMASSSIPVVFPPFYFEGNYYVDGGVYSNELVIPGIEYCLDRGYTNITIDSIVCSPPINKITNTEIYSDTLIGIASRAYDIMSNVVFNHELYSICNNYKEIKIILPMYIYKPNEPYPGSLLDFDKKDLLKMFNMGFNLPYPKPTKYCFQ